MNKNTKSILVILIKFLINLFKIITIPIQIVIMVIAFLWRLFIEISDFVIDSIKKDFKL